VSKTMSSHQSNRRTKIVYKQIRPIRPNTAWTTRILGRSDSRDAGALLAEEHVVGGIIHCTDRPSRCRHVEAIPDGWISRKGLFRRDQSRGAHAPSRASGVHVQIMTLESGVSLATVKWYSTCRDTIELQERIEINSPATIRACKIPAFGFSIWRYCTFHQANRTR
jgi:hypothetical protein